VVCLGEKIGEVGNIGYFIGLYLYFEIYLDGGGLVDLIFWFAKYGLCV